MRESIDGCNAVDFDFHNFLLRPDGGTMTPETALWPLEPEENFVTMDDSLDAWKRFANA